MVKKKEPKQHKGAPKWLKAVGKVFVPFRPIGRYFKGSWTELRQVKWPTRKASISLTFAVIVFTLIMTGFIVLLDTGFEALVKRIIL